MKRVVTGILIGGAIMLTPITAQANSLSYIPTEEETGIPVSIYENAEIIGDTFNICPELLESIAYQESRYDPTVIGGSCKGLMQLNTCHNEKFVDAGWKSTDWSDPYKNMYVGAQYLAELFAEYEDAATVLMVYHGEKNAVQNGKSGKLSSYATEILERSEELERFHGK